MKRNVMLLCPEILHFCRDSRQTHFLFSCIYCYDTYMEMGFFVFRETGLRVIPENIGLKKEIVMSGDFNDISNDLTDDITAFLDLEQDLVDRMGDCPNAERKTHGESPLWRTIKSRDGWKLQQRTLSGKARIVDGNGRQKGNGSIPAMWEKMNRLLSDEFVRPGDVIGVSRKLYEHYGIYVGAGRVIHYAGEGGDFGGRISIHETRIDNFLKDGEDYFVVSFGSGFPVKLRSETSFFIHGVMDYYHESFQQQEWKVFSPEETVRRAYSRLGEEKYSLISNNCEHFAIWCKTGKAQSSQVRQVAGYVLAAGIDMDDIAENREDVEAYLASSIDF